MSAAHADTGTGEVNVSGSSVRVWTEGQDVRFGIVKASLNGTSATRRRQLSACDDVCCRVTYLRLSLLS